ncbi:MAG: peptidase M48 [Candidatus Mesenet longicola]|nr:MAG: peptidase M48 [Candidatus Mesenet longicola]
MCATILPNSSDIMNAKFYSFLLILFFCHTNSYAIQLIRDSEAESIIRELTVPLFKAANVDSNLVKVFIVDDKALNAYVIDNNNIFINLGLIQYSTSPYPMLGVIAHELGHIAAGHVLQRDNDINNAKIAVYASYLLGIISAITVDPAIGTALIQGGSHLGERAFLNNNRVQEEIADQYALKYLDSAGYSNSGIQDILRYLDKSEHPQIDQYSLTHPLSSKRLFYVQNYQAINNIQPIPADKLYRFKRLVTKLDAFSSPINTLLDKYSDESDLSKYACAIIYYRQSKIDKSIEQLESLIEDSPQDPYYHELKGEILYKIGKIDQSAASYKQALSLVKNQSTLIKLQLSQALLLKDPQEAVFYLERASAEEKNSPFIWKQLAIAYGRSGNIGMSYFALTKKAFLEEDTSKFKKYSELAIKNLPQDSPYLLQIDDMLKYYIKM